MPRIQYVEWKPAPATRKVVAAANAIIAEYQQAGFDLTLRQLYYQFVARGLLPNRQSEYKRLGSIVNDGRLAGLIDWDAIVDRTRNVRSLAHWTEPGAIVAAAAEQYKVDLWKGQPFRCEVWIEKDALVGVIADVCDELDVPYFSCRGYVSQSELWGAGQRLGRHMERDEQVKIVVFHLGDHDPSGIDMSRDIEDRLKLFLTRDWAAWATKKWPELMKARGEREITGEIERSFWSERLEVRRVALNFDQIEQYEPPPNPAKETDARFAGYQQEHGDESWELDALDPQVLADLIRGAIESVIEPDLRDDQETLQLRHQRELRLLSQRYGEVVKVLGS